MNGPSVSGLIVLGLVFFGIFWLIRRDGQKVGERMLPALTPDAPRPTTIVRTYRGHNQEDAVRYMRPEADELAGQGYIVSAQSWAAGSWGCGAFLIALILFVILVGILIFAYMLLVK